VFASRQEVQGNSQKKRRPFRVARVVLAAMRLDDSRVRVDPHWGTDLRHIQNQAGIVTAGVIPAIICTWPSSASSMRPEPRIAKFSPIALLRLAIARPRRDG
jgi:hypothetical protein